MSKVELLRRLFCSARAVQGVANKKRSHPYSRHTLRVPKAAIGSNAISEAMDIQAVPCAHCRDLTEHRKVGLVQLIDALRKISVAAKPSAVRPA
jgi:hypothetical protein